MIPNGWRLSTRDVVARAIATEIQSGRGTKNGGVYLDVTHLPRVQIETRLPVMLEQFLKFGVDIRDQPMEVAPTAHHIMGGLRITTECRTTIPGLFACGEVAGGVHGANRLGGNALAETQVFGKRAGEFAGKAEKRMKKIDENQINQQLAFLDSLLKGSENPARVRIQLQQAMWQGAGIFRNAPDLNKTLETINNLSSAHIKAESPRNLAECCIVRNMMLTASHICRSALIRNESRGAHVRIDIPQTYDAQHSPYSHTFISLSRTRDREKHGGIMKEITARVYRFDPEKDADAHFDEFTVKVNEGARVLHVLHAIHDTLDPTLAYRYSCGSGQCGRLCCTGKWRTGACLHGRSSK